MAVTRRNFIRTTGAATAVVAGGSLFGPTSLFAAGPYMRRDLGGLAADDPILEDYRTAIAAMQALPSSDPLSWAYQAAIHGTTLMPALPAWNTCPHGSLHFLSWHRMYLWFFERIIRQMSGNPEWALPYWNYESPAQRFLPAPFRTPTVGNPLYTPNRGAGWNAGTAFLSASSVDSTDALADIPFNNFQSSLEGTPHAAIHISMSSWMGSVATAAQDPVFWLHHCNIDRYWNLWLAQMGGRSNPLGDNAWKSTPFLFFDELGNPVELKGCDVLRAAQQLDYVYENEPPQVNQFCITLLNPKWLLIPIIKFKFFPVPPIPDPPPWILDVERVRERLLEVAFDREHDLVLELSVEADMQPNVFWEVYVGLPAGAPPRADSPFFAGNIALFGHGFQGGHHQQREQQRTEGGFKPAEFRLQIDEAVQAALAQDGGAGKLTLTFVPRAAEHIDQRVPPKPSTGLRIHRMTIGAARLQDRG